MFLSKLLVIIVHGLSLLPDVYQGITLNLVELWVLIKDLYQKWLIFDGEDCMVLGLLLFCKLNLSTEVVYILLTFLCNNTFVQQG